MSQTYRWTTATDVRLCAECHGIPPALFKPGSTVTHRIHRGPRGEESLGQNAADGCRLCIAVLDAIRSSPSPDGAGLNGDGILLASHWSGGSLIHTTKPSHYDATAARMNLHRVELQVLTGHGDPASAPLLVITWATAKRRALRFNLQETKPGSDASEYRTTWQEYPLDFAVPGWDWRRGNEGPPSQPVAPQADSPQTIALMNQWLDKCQQDHGSVCKFVGERVITTNFSSPARLIYCGQGPLCLVDAADLPHDEEGLGPSYTTLSYRWGDPASLHTTTKANLEASLHALSFDDLPLTFQHAIQITRAIKVSYIWIDALCIVQDDDADKAREIFRMDLIYATAICMISASSSEDTHAGIFQTRPSLPDAHLRSFTLSTDDKERGAVSVTIQPYLADWGNAITNGPLYQRGWCFQERLLSKRVIYFTETRVMWECRWAVASEDYPSLLDVGQATSLFSPNLPPRVGMDRVRDRVLPPGDPRRTRPWIADWCQVVQAYSGRSLTYPSDRLPALAGLAAHFGKKLHNPWDPDMSTYLAGMWKESLAMQLSWFPDYTSRRPSRPGDPWPSPLRTASTLQDVGPADYLEDWLPSWSWISLSGPLHYRYSSGTIDPPSINGAVFDVQDGSLGLPMSYHPMEVTALTIIFPGPRDNYEYGSVKGGYICLTGHLAVVSISEGNLLRPDDLLILPTTGTRPKLYSMYRPPVSSLFRGLLPGDRRRPACAEGIVYFDTDPPRLPENTKIHCLRLGTGPSAFSSTHGAVDYGLALMEVANSFQLDRRGGVVRMDGSSESARFPRMRRVGLFEVDIWNKEWPAKAITTSVIVV
ncbi:hypothetical protein OQA88_2517 [Cercophora sp. LCS_1]